jgi:hypothetical protein
MAGRTLQNILRHLVLIPIRVKKSCCFFKFGRRIRPLAEKMRASTLTPIVAPAS